MKFQDNFGTPFQRPSLKVSVFEGSGSQPCTTGTLTCSPEPLQLLFFCGAGDDDYGNDGGDDEFRCLPDEPTMHMMHMMMMMMM